MTPSCYTIDRNNVNREKWQEQIIKLDEDLKLMKLEEDDHQKQKNQIEQKIKSINGEEKRKSQFLLLCKIFSLDDLYIEEEKKKKPKKRTTFEKFIVVQKRYFPLPPTFFFKNL